MATAVSDGQTSLIPNRCQTLNNSLNQTRTWQNPSLCHPWADIDWLLGATDMGTRSVLLLLRGHLGRLKARWRHRSLLKKTHLAVACLGIKKECG
jgi:hypothetical protein